MLPIIPKPAITKGQKGAALAIAGFVDLLQMGVFPAFGWGLLSPAQDGLDFVTAVLLVAICGFKWQFVVGFMAELVPGLALFPTWTAVVLLLSTRGEEQAGAGGSPQRVNVSEARVVEEREMVDGEAVAVPPVQGPARASRAR